MRLCLKNGAGGWLNRAAFIILFIILLLILCKFPRVFQSDAPGSSHILSSSPQTSVPVPSSAPPGEVQNTGIPVPSFVCANSSPGPWSALPLCWRCLPGSAEALSLYQTCFYKYTPDDLSINGKEIQIETWHHICGSRKHLYSPLHRIFTYKYFTLKMLIK